MWSTGAMVINKRNPKKHRKTCHIANSFNKNISCSHSGVAAVAPQQAGKRLASSTVEWLLNLITDNNNNDESKQINLVL
jgi:hypothetical protein